jgi:hypothetical protein
MSPAVGEFRQTRPAATEIDGIYTRHCRVIVFGIVRRGTPYFLPSMTWATSYRWGSISSVGKLASVLKVELAELLQRSPKN